MSRSKLKEISRLDVLRAIDEVRSRLSGIDILCFGTLMKRMKSCGKSSCRCAHDPSARHGPYYEWRRKEGGRFVHTVVSYSEAMFIRRAIKNFREVEDLLEEWRRLSRILMSMENVDSG